MICFPNAKINLGLNIVSKREDGYHNLETIFYPIAIKDALEIIVKEEQTEDKLFESGLDIEAKPEDNLVMKALKLMREKYDFPKLDVHLLKKIPFGSGIGGGSADATFMLMLINDQFSLNISKEELISLSVQLGADCPFFVYNHPVFASGVGELFEKIDLSLLGYKMMLIMPNIHVSTKDAFMHITPSKPHLSLKEVVKHPIQEWKNMMVNDFEKSVFKKYPQIEELKNELYNQGAVYASMTGSGSSVFGIFKDEYPNIETLDPNYFIWKGDCL